MIDNLGLMAVTLFLLSATVGLFQADARRATLPWLARSKSGRRVLRALSLGCLALTLAALAARTGLEIGLSVWLGLLSVVGTLSLLVAAFSRRVHLAVGVSAGSLGALAAATFILLA